MKEVMAVIKMNMMNKTKQALTDAGIISFTAKDVIGRGRGIVDDNVLKGADQGFEEAIAQLGTKGRLVPKRILWIAVPDKLVRRTVETIISTNQTGRSSGEGKIFVLPLVNAIRVRTGEEGDRALDEF
jgi:nitrogen regulatory protein PII 2